MRLLWFRLYITKRGSFIWEEDLPQEFVIENLSINVEFLNIRTGQITAGAYAVSITEIVCGCQQIDTGAFLIIDNYFLGLLWGNQCFLLFNSHS